MGRFLFDISKQPGFEYLAHYGDSVIYYNEKFDHEEQSGNIEKAIADYKQQRQQEMYHQMIKSFGVAAVIVLVLLGISYGWKTWLTKRRIDQLQMLLQEQKAKEIRGNHNYSFSTSSFMPSLAPFMIWVTSR